MPSIVFVFGLHLGYKKAATVFYQRTKSHSAHDTASCSPPFVRWSQIKTHLAGVCNLIRWRKKTYWKKLECVGYDFKDKASTENEKRSKITEATENEASTSCIGRLLVLQPNRKKCRILQKRGLENHWRHLRSILFSFGFLSFLHEYRGYRI